MPGLHWRIRLGIVFMLLFSSGAIFAQKDSPQISVKGDLILLQIPERSAEALDGSEFARQIEDLCLEEREEAVIREVLSGNVPSFSRNLKALRIQESLNSTTYELVIYVACDYLAIGSDLDYLYMPLTPAAAQYLADTLNCILPTKILVDKIYKQAEIKLHPQPIPPSDSMTTVPIFHQHTDSIRHQYRNKGLERSTDKIVAGHKKDIILSNKIHDLDRTSGCVVIYGWHRSENQPIQPVYNGHVDWYADYSHGVRFISNQVLINGIFMKAQDLLRNPELSFLLSSEGVIKKLYIPVR